MYGSQCKPESGLETEHLVQAHGAGDVLAAGAFLGKSTVDIFRAQICDRVLPLHHP